MDNMETSAIKEISTQSNDLIFHTKGITFIFPFETEEELLRPSQAMINTNSIRVFPTYPLSDVKGRAINVQQLAKDHRLILIVVKNSKCKLSPELLRILNLYGLDPHCTTYKDPFTREEMSIDPQRKRFFRFLLERDAYFIVLCPGPCEEVAKMQRDAHFEQYPFIGGDQANKLGECLNLGLKEDLGSAIMKVSRHSLYVDYVCGGIREGHYTQDLLLKRLLSERVRWEMKGCHLLKEAHRCVDRLKRRIVKCENKKMVVGVPMPLLFPVDCPLTPEPTRLQPTFASCLPLEILELILSMTSSTVDLVRMSRTSQQFYMTVCHILSSRIRHQMDIVLNALPVKNEQVISDEMEAMNPGVNRWTECEQGISYRELQSRIETMSQLLNDVCSWTRHWIPRSPRQTLRTRSSRLLPVE
ncbi:hypothetical protein BDF14DRAFT_1746812 [Spinellus fusiger]|nr:hypothetical protein BDF14DRAFT_1746812 [Spinellus fusiger]